jgi:DnaJ family protein A protein 2
MYNFENQELYKILEISKNATKKEISKAYRKLAIKHHPDKGGDEEKFKKISGAYEILKDEEKRKIYDQHGIDGLKAHNEGHPGGMPRDIFDMFGGGFPFSGGNPFGGGFFTGGRSRGPQKGQPVHVQLSVSLEQLYNGATRKLRIKRNILCQPCHSTGSKSKNPTTCRKCKGQGHITQIRSLGPMQQIIQAPCPDCQGSGRNIKKNDICQKCKGNRVHRTEEILEINIKPGIKHKDFIMFAEKGDEHPDIVAGDIIVVIKEEKHETFIRKGEHLIMKKSVSLKNALCGCSFEINLLSGKSINVKTNKGEILKPGQFKIIRNYGMPKNDGSHGDLYIKFKIIFPNDIDKRVIMKLEKLLNCPKQKTNDDNNLYVEMENISSSAARRSLEEQFNPDDDEEQYDGEGCPIQ